MAFEAPATGDETGAIDADAIAADGVVIEFHLFGGGDVTGFPAFAQPCDEGLRGVEAAPFVGHAAGHSAWPPVAAVVAAILEAFVRRVDLDSI